MDFDLIFPVGERAVTGICCGRDHQFRESFASEKVGGVGAQAPERAPEPAVFELVLLAALFQKLGVALLQIVETLHEDLFRDVAKECRQRPQLLAAKRLGFRRQIATHDGFLVEQTELDGNVRKKTLDQAHRAFPAIDRHAGEPPALADQML